MSIFTADDHVPGRSTTERDVHVVHALRMSDSNFVIIGSCAAGRERERESEREPVNVRLAVHTHTW